MQVSSTVPRSPDASLLLTKRRCPFGESPRDMKIPASAHSMAENDTEGSCLEYTNSQGDSAFHKLMQSQQASPPASPASGYIMTSNKCWICEKQSETMPCTFCERIVCEMCVRQCDKCFGVFCSSCATVKYDRHEDRALCLGCNTEDSKKRRAKAIPSSRLH